jgi:serine phosphatase RsbU (regulator of sigma subunit)
LLVSEREPKRFLLAVAQLCVDRFATTCAISIRAGEGEPEAIAERQVDLPPRERFAHSEPLEVGEVPLGTIRWELERPFDAFEIEIARTLAKIVAAGFERSRSSAFQYRIADRLQRALLPGDLARPAGVRFDTSYLPATHETDVGGDWYDAFDIGDGRIGISIGDVAGHGLDAAVAMGEARRAIRVAAAGAASPAELLDYVNDILTFDESAGMATAIAGFFDPVTHVLEYASAGHPPPVYAGPDRRPFVLPAGGMPLGIQGAIASPNRTFTIEPGSSLFVYTDGLLEYGRDILAGERALIAAISELPAAQDADHAVLLNDAIFSTCSNTDDVATLVLRSQRDWNESETFVYSAEAGLAAAARSAVGNHPALTERTPEYAGDVIAAAGEAIANAIEHGSRAADATFRVHIAKVAQTLEIVVENDGQWHPTQHGEDRGRGISIMQALATSMRIATNRDRTSVRLTFSTPTGIA